MITRVLWLVDQEGLLRKEQMRFNDGEEGWTARLLEEMEKISEPAAAN